MTETATPFELDFARRLLRTPASSPDEYAEALGRLVAQFDALVNRLATQDSQHAELQTSLKIARSNLVLAEANADALEEALRRRGGAQVGATTPELSQGGWDDSTASSPTYATGAEKLAFWKRKKSNGGSALVPPQPNGRGRSPSPGVERSPVLDGPDSPVAQQPDAEAQQLAARLANAQSLLEQERRTTKRQAEAFETLKTTFTSLEADHVTLRSAHDTLQNEHRELHRELETLSQALFEEANRMVAVERQDKSKLETELADLRGQLEEMRMAAEQQLEVELGLSPPLKSEMASPAIQTPPDSSQVSPARPATMPAQLEEELTRSQQRFRERVASEPRVEVVPPRKQSLAASAGSNSSPPSRDVSPRPSPRMPDVSTMPPMPVSPTFLQQSASLRKTIPTAVRAASPPLVQSADGMASIDAVLERAGTIDRALEHLPESPSPKGLSLRTIPARGASRDTSREASPSVSAMTEGIESFPAMPDAPSPSPSPTSPHGRAWQSAFESRLKGPAKTTSPSIDDALASIAADADSIISEPSLSPAQSLRGKANFFDNTRAPQRLDDSTADPTGDALEEIMDESSLTDDTPVTSVDSSATAVEERTPEPEQPRSQFDDTNDDSRDERISIAEPSWLSELKVRKRPAPFTSKPDAFTIPPSTSDRSIAPSTSDTSLAYAAETISSVASERAEDDLDVSQDTPRIPQASFERSSSPRSAPSSQRSVSATHGARLLDTIYKVQQQNGSRDSTASASTASLSAASSTRTSASSDKQLAAMSFPHRGDVPNALKKTPAVGLLSSLAVEDVKPRSTSASSNRSRGATSPIGDDLDSIMRQINDITAGSGIDSETEDIL